MKVKIGSEIYDGGEQPVMVILSKGEREQIANMPDGYEKYCVYPDNYTEEEIRAWMQTEEETN